MESVQHSTLPGELSPSSSHISRRHSTTGYTVSFPQGAIGSEAEGSSAHWAVGRSLPPLLQNTLSPPRADASSSRVHLPPLDTHQYPQVQSEPDPSTLQHYPNKRRRLSGTLPPQPHAHSLGLADSPGPRGQSDRPGNQPHSSSNHARLNIQLIAMPSDPTVSRQYALPPPFGRQEWTQQVHTDLVRSESQCCSNECQGPKCTVIRRIIKDLFAEVDARIPAIGASVETESQRIQEVRRRYIRVGNLTFHFLQSPL